MVENFKHEITECSHMVPEISKVMQFTIPFRGFNSSVEIPLSSAVCFISANEGKEQINTNGVFTYDDIPESSVVFVEHSAEIGVHTPLVQCEYCLTRDDVMYTCKECRYKTYCCLECMERDKSLHVFECAGYMNAALIVMDAVSIFRIFTRIFSTLKSSLLKQKRFQEFESAYELLSILPLEIEAQLLCKNQYMCILVAKPLYEKLTDVQYSTLVATAFRLTMYLNRNTYLLEDFLKNLTMTNKEKLILVGSVLMRLQCHVFLNTFDFEYILSSPMDMQERNTEDVQKLNNLRSFRGRVININDYYNVKPQEFRAYLKEKTDVVEKISSSNLPPIRHPSLCNPIQRLLPTYTDKIVEMCFAQNSEDFLLFTEGATVPTTELTASMMSQTFAQMSEDDRYDFIELFSKNFHKNFLDYFLGLKRSKNFIPQIVSSLCTTLSKFRHSCQPNVEVMLLEDGFIIGKALRRIEKWEEIVVSFKANYIIHPYHERFKYLYRINIFCNCNQCQTPMEQELINFRSGVYCHKCMKEISPAIPQCSNCSTYYTKELLRYRKEIHLIEMEINEEEDERKLFLLHLALYVLGRKNFIPSNEICINMEIKFASFLAVKNAGREAFKILEEVKGKVLNSYKCNEIWYSFFTGILSVIDVLLTNNIDQGLQSLPLDCLKHLCELGLKILKNQYIYLQFYEIFDYYCHKIIPAVRKYLIWKEELICWDVNTKVEELCSLSACDKSEDDLPALSDY